MLRSHQFKSGKNVEAFLDDYFRYRGWVVELTSAHEEQVQHLGDRHFTRDGDTWLIEYKSGVQTFYTGNVFLETISVDSEGVPGLSRVENRLGTPRHHALRSDAQKTLRNINALREQNCSV